MDENNITQEQATMTVQNGQAQEPAAGTGAAQQPAASAAAPEKKAGAHVHPGGRE